MSHIEHEVSNKLGGVKICAKEVCRLPFISSLHQGAVLTSTMILA